MLQSRWDVHSVELLRIVFSMYCMDHKIKSKSDLASWQTKRLKEQWQNACLQARPRLGVRTCGRADVEVPSCSWVAGSEIPFSAFRCACRLLPASWLQLAAAGLERYFLSLFVERAARWLGVVPVHLRLHFLLQLGFL